MWQIPERPTALGAYNLAVLIPYSQGIWLYVRRSDRQALHHALSSSHSRSPVEVVDFLCHLPQPRLATWLGADPSCLLGDLIVREIDLCIIPDRWMKHIPISQTCQRAQFALQLTEAFLKEPIRLFGRKRTGCEDEEERIGTWVTSPKIC